MPQTILQSKECFNSLVEVPEMERPYILPKYFGPKMMQVEATIFGALGNLSPNYTGATWAFYEIPNGFYMAPKMDDELKLEIAGNYFEDHMSADAAGIVTCLYVYSHMSFKYPEDNFANLYHALRDFASGHIESSKIYKAID